MTSPDLTDANIDKLAELFPTVVTESVDADGNVKMAVDFDLLRQELSDHIVEGPQERYRLDWPGKRAAAFAANAPIAKTLRPVREESVEFDNTKNLFIEGDNLDALKLIQESYLGSVQLIYIDPPYNTGNDLVYNDDFAETTDQYLRRSGQVDEIGTRLVANSESNGRFHSDWLSMMYPRLKLARSLLSSDGVVAISIDANELSNIVRIGSEVFGAGNCLGVISVVNNLKGRSDDAFFATANEFLVVFARDIRVAAVNGFPPDAAYLEEFKLKDSVSRYKEVGLRKTGKNSRRVDRPNLFYPIFYRPEDGMFSLDAGIDDVEIFPLDSDGAEGTWRWGRETFDANRGTELTARVVNGRWNVYVKMRDLVDGVPRTVRPKTVWIDPKYDTGGGKRGIQALFDGKAVFDNPKPVPFLIDVLRVLTGSESLVMDFFAGSGTLAQAVMELNSADGGRRQFIMVQLDEVPAEGSEAANAGFVSLADVSRERLRRAGRSTISKAGLTSMKPDVGFRALRVDTSNFSDVLRSPDKTEQLALHELEASVKPDRSADDLLFQVLLGWGLELTMPISIEQIEQHDVFVVEDGALIACFDEHVSPAVVHSIAKRQPLRAVFRDSGFASDAARINAEQVFREVSPTTEVKAI